MKRNRREENSRGKYKGEENRRGKKQEKLKEKKRGKREKPVQIANYSQYSFDKKELAIELVRAAVQVIFTGILFFRSWIGCLVLSPLIVWILRKRRLKHQQEKRNELRMDFKEVILSISASLHAGYSLEQTIPVALEDMKRLYPGEDRVMIRELVWMIRNLQMNAAPEQLFADFAVRSGLEEIRNFAVILLTVRKQGGNLVRISRESAEHISQKIQVQMEIDQVIAGKKMEKNIMIYMPYFILIYLQLTNASYMSPLFHNFYGSCCMAACLGAIYAADWWADKVIRIPV